MIDSNPQLADACAEARMSRVLNGPAVRQRRDDLEMTQAQLAAKAKLQSAQYVSDLENGRRKNPTADVVLRLANALKCSVEDLLTQKSPPKKRRK